MMNKKMLVITAVLAGLSLCVVATRPPANAYRNLKVLPKDISSRDLNRVMVDEFTDGLGVSCNFCHAENSSTHEPDYASDLKPEKSMARTMMRMTIGLNKKYFKLKHASIGDAALVVTCSTCHNGQPHPGNTGAGE